MRALFFSAILFSSALLFTPSLLAQSQKVESGTEVDAADPLTRSIARVRITGGLCSASFLSPTTLITAGHCTSETTVSDTIVEIRDKTGKWYAMGASEVITHPKFKIQNTMSGTLVAFDMGLIKLPAAFPIKVRPLKLAAVDDLRAGADQVTVAGYGLSSKTGGAGVLRFGTMVAQVLNVPLFTNRDGLYMEPTGAQVVCPGDSGGAVLRDGPSSLHLIGVNSLSNGCKGNSKPSSFSEVPYFQKAWIKKVAPEVP